MKTPAIHDEVSGTFEKKYKIECVFSPELSNYQVQRKNDSFFEEEILCSRTL